MSITWCRGISAAGTPENLTLLCSGHHRAQHDGLLTITGLAPSLEVKWKYLPHTDASSQLPHVGQPAESQCVHAEPSAPLALPRSTPSSPETSDTDPARRQNVGASNYALIVTKTEAVMALAQMGFTKQEARAVVDEAANRLPRGASFDQLVRAALKLTRR